MVRIGIIEASHEGQSRLLKGDLPANVAAVFQTQIAALVQDSSRDELRAAQPDIVLVESVAADSLPSAVAHIKGAVPKAWILAVGVKPEANLLIRAVQAGARDFLAKPVTPSMLSDVLNRFYQENPSALMPPGKLLVVTSPKGGCGSTCIAINLAAAISRFPETHVALVDLGTPLGDIAAYLGLKSVYGLHDALEAGDRLDSVLLGTYMHSKCGLEVLTGATEFQSPVATAEASLERLIDVLSRNFTHSVLDLSLHLPGKMLRETLKRADEILIAITPEIPSIWSALRFLYYIEDLRVVEQARIILNRNQTSNQIHIKDIEKLLQRKIFHALPNNYPAMIEAVNSGLPVVGQGRANVSQSFMKLAEGLTGLKVGSKRRKIFQLFS